MLATMHTSHVACALLLVAASFTAGCASTQKPPAHEVSHKPEPTVDVEELEVGNGPRPKDGQVVVVHYVERLADTSRLVADTHKSKKPREFTVGEGKPVPGFDQALSAMQVGGKYKLTIPWELGHGDSMHEDVPAKSRLIFEVELVSIKDGEKKVAKKARRGGILGGGNGSGNANDGMGGGMGGLSGGRRGMSGKLGTMSF